MPGKESKILTSYSTSLLCEPTEIDSMDSMYDYIGAGKGLAILAWRTSTHEGLGTISNRIIPTHGRTRCKPPQQPPIAKPARSTYLLLLECWKVKRSKQGDNESARIKVVSYGALRWLIMDGRSRCGVSRHYMQKGATASGWKDKILDNHCHETLLLRNYDETLLT